MTCDRAPTDTPAAGAGPGDRGTTRLPMLLDGIPVLVRPDNQVHIGSDPHSGLVLRLPPTASSKGVAALIDSLRVPRTGGEVFGALIDAGLTRRELDTILSRLVAEGKAVAAVPRRRPDPLRIRVHGTGPLTRLLTTSLADAGFVISQTSRRGSHSVGSDAPPMSSVEANLVVLTDHVVHESWVVSRLMRTRTPHLQVRLRDGTGLIGPLVLPGLSSCLECADRHRADRDPAWPVLAAQLTGTGGHASAAIARATAALAHDQIAQLAVTIGVVAPETPPPYLVDRVLELHAAPPRIDCTRWTPHPLCRCHTVAGRYGDG